MSSLEELESASEEEDRRMEEQREKETMETKLMNEPETIKNLGITTIYIPDLTKKQPCKEPTVLAEHVQIKELYQLIIDRIKFLDSSLKELKQELEEEKKKEQSRTRDMKIETKFNIINRTEGRIQELIRLGNIAEGDLK